MRQIQEEKTKEFLLKKKIYLTSASSPNGFSYRASIDGFGQQPLQMVTKSQKQDSHMYQQVILTLRMFLTDGIRSMTGDSIDTIYEVTARQSRRELNSFKITDVKMTQEVL